MSGGYETAIRESIPQAKICFDPFHVVRLGQRAVDQVRRDEWNAHDRSHTPKGRWIKGTRWSLLKSPDKQSVPQLALLSEVQHANKAMFRAFVLKEELRVLYQLEDRALAPAHLDAWLASNVAAITGYTNTWIRDAAPEHHLGRIRELGVPADRLRELLNDHLVSYELLYGDRFAEFRDDRLQRLQQLVARTLKPIQDTDATAPNESTL